MEIWKLSKGTTLLLGLIKGHKQYDVKKNATIDATSPISLIAPIMKLVLYLEINKMIYIIAGLKIFDTWKTA